MFHPGIWQFHFIQDIKIYLSSQTMPLNPDFTHNFILRTRAAEGWFFHL